MIKSYSELIDIPLFEDRIEYLRTSNRVGEETFGNKRYLNQILYSSDEWKNIRRRIIVRDSNGENPFDLAHPDRIFFGVIYIHHINPITVEDILERRYCVFDPENLVACSFDTHELIHFGHGRPMPSNIVIRKPYDTCPWRL